MVGRSTSTTMFSPAQMTTAIFAPTSDGNTYGAVQRLGMNGNSTHQATVNKLRQLARWEFGPNVRYEENKSIKNVLGVDRRPDVSVWSEDGRLLKVYEAARIDRFGNFVPREQRKMYEYYEMGIPYYFEQVR